MVELTVILLVLGVAALLVELLLPGVEYFGIAGVILLVVSAVLAVIFMPVYGLFVVAGVGVVVGGFLLFMLRFMRQKQMQGKLIMHENLAEDIPQVVDVAQLIGREGRAVSALRPYGEVDFNGLRIEVSSGGPLIAEGTKVKVTDAQPGKIVVCAADSN